jgi:hypothetical protein
MSRWPVRRPRLAAHVMPVGDSRRRPSDTKEMRCVGTSRGGSNSDDLEPGHFDVILVLRHDRNR